MNYSFTIPSGRKAASFVIILWLCVFPLSGFAQLYKVSGSVLDGKDNQSLIGVVISLSPRNDSSKVQNAVTDIEGAFILPNVAAGEYILKASYVGYQAITRSVDVINEDAATGAITMVQASSGLSGVTVTAEQIRAQQSGDTAQFNAGSYKTNRDATAEELITKMPGITTEGGAVKVNGEDVKKILVDGKEFFGDDANAAIKNLPAEIIDKIQVFDKSSDQAQFSGFDDGNSQKTINIVTKKGRNNGSFGKIAAGYGIDDETTDGRYTVGGNINFFNGDRRISIVGLTNNVNQQNFSSEDLLGVSGSSGSRNSGRNRGGGGSPGGDAASNFLVPQQGGITTTQSVGINYSDQWSPKLKVSGSYFFNRGKNENATELLRTYVVSNPDSGLVYSETSLNSSTNINHRASARLEWTIDSFNSIILAPRISFQDNSSERLLDGRTTLQAAGDQNRTLSKNQTSNTGYSLNNQLTYRHRFAKQGRTISLSTGSTYNEKTGNGLLYSDNYYSTADSEINDQHYDLEANGLTLSGNLSYTEPLTKKSQLMLTYSPSYTRNISDRKTYNRIGAEYTDLDTPLSNEYNNDYYYQRGGFGYRYSDQKINFNATLNAQYATLTGDQAFPYPTIIDRNFKDLLPQAMLNYKFSKTENLRFSYRSTTNAPNISQLQNLVDNSNPLFLRTGNPELRQDYSHNASLRYGKTNTKNGTGLFVFANGTYVNHYIGNSTIIAVNDTVVNGLLLNRGSQLSMPENLDGAWSGRSFLTYSLPLKPIKTNLNLNAGVNYNRIPAITNSRPNFTDNYTLNGGFVAGSNISENIDFTLSSNASYNIVKNNLQEQNNYNYYSQTNSLRLNWIFLDGFVFNTNLNHTFYTGLEEGYNQQFLLWNASLGYKFLKSKALQADIYAFDILKQNRAISRTVTETYIEDARAQVLQRYFMLRLTYTLRSFKGASADTDASAENDVPGNRPARGDGPGRTRGDRIN